MKKQNIKKRVASLSYLLLAVFISPSHANQVADKVFTNGQIETLNSKQPTAQAVAIKDEKFIAIGSNKKVQSFIGSNTKVVDLQHQLEPPRVYRRL